MRASHANLDAEKRRLKAQKIIALLTTARALAGARILEIGAGSGVIAAELARAAEPAGTVFAIDVVDERLITAGYTFQQVEDVRLPFQADSFDVVVSNHVIEHVGDRRAQLVHLQEIERVLSPDGRAYLAVPNRWCLIEPHFRLPFLSWLPRSLRSPYVRVAGRGRSYDVDPPSHGELKSLFRQAALAGSERSFEAIEIVRVTEPLNIATRLIGKAPRGVLRLLHPIFPTYVFLLSKK